MERDLVEEKGWIESEEYKEGLALAQLAPGPLAAQLAIYLGWLRGGFMGAAAVGVAFVLPSFVMVLLLAWFYLNYQGLPWLQAAFYGIGSAVIAIILNGAKKLIQKTLKKDLLLWLLFAVSALVTALTAREILWVFVLCGLVALAVRSGKKFFKGSSSLALLPPVGFGWGAALGGAKPVELLLFFAKAGSVVFGSGLAIVPFLHGGLVQEHGWLNERQFLDAVAVAMVTPGPVVITVAFVGALIAGPLGACAAALGVFMPCYLIVVLAAPYYRRFAQDQRIRAFVDGVTASAVGALTGAIWVLGRRSIVDLPTILIFASSLVVVFRLKKIPEPILILAAGLAGVLLKAF
jgi:chromate transporter